MVIHITVTLKEGTTVRNTMIIVALMLLLRPHLSMSPKLQILPEFLDYKIQRNLLMLENYMVSSMTVQERIGVHQPVTVGLFSRH